MLRIAQQALHDAGAVEVGDGPPHRLRDGAAAFDELWRERQVDVCGDKWLSQGFDLVAQAAAADYRVELVAQAEQQIETSGQQLVYLLLCGEVVVLDLYRPL